MRWDGLCLWNLCICFLTEPLGGHCNLQRKFVPVNGLQLLLPECLRNVRYRKGNDKNWRYSVVVIASCAVVTQPVASHLGRLVYIFFFLPVIHYQGAELFLQNFCQLSRLLNSSHSSQVFRKELFCTWNYTGACYASLWAEAFPVVSTVL